MPYYPPASSSGGAPTDATYITQTANATLSAEQALSSLSTGYAKVANGTGVISSQVVPIPVADGGTATTTAFTQGSVVFAGASGVYSQDNANFFFDDTKNALGLGTTSPTARMHAVTTDWANPTTLVAGGTNNTPGYSRSTVTADPGGGHGGFTAETSVSLTSNPASGFTSTGFNGTGNILATDTAVYPAVLGGLLAGLRGGTIATTYAGTGSIPDVDGMDITVQRTSVGSGTITNMMGVRVLMLQSRASGTVSKVVNYYASTPIGAASGTITDTYGVFIQSQTTAAGTQTNTPYGVYQEGTSDINLFGGMVRGSNGVSINKAPAASHVIPANYSMYVAEEYQIAAATTVEIGAGAVLEIG